MTATGRGSGGDRLTATVRTTVDVVAMAFLTLVALIPLQPSYGDNGFWLALAGGVLLGAGIALLGVRLRGGPLEVAALTVVGYFLFGGLFAVRSSTILGVIPSLETLRDLALGVVFSWKRLLTIQAPVTGFDQLLVVPFLAGLVGAVLAVSFALRLRRYGFALVPVGTLLVVAVAFSTHEPLLPALVGGLLTTVGLAWVAWRRARARAESAHAELLGVTESSSAGRRRVILAAGLAFAAGIAGVGLASAADGQDRAVLRELVVPPLELHDYPSPLMSFRKYVTAGADTTLFTVEGLEPGARVRLATLDLYDGMVYKVSGSGGSGAGVFSRVGRTIAGAPEGKRATVHVEIGDLRGVWVPDAGSLAGLRFEGERSEQLTEGLHYNRATGTAVTTAGLRAGDSYTFEATLPETISDVDLAASSLDEAITLPGPEKVPDVLVGVTSQIAHPTLPKIERLLAIHDFLRQGFFSHGLDTDAVESPSGHSQWRLARMFEVEQLLGDQEQYAVAMALMAAESGIPARVVMGFEQPESTSGPVAVTGEDVTAWVEVPLQGRGWVAIDPTPDNDPENMEKILDKRSKPRNSMPQPPLPPQEPVELPDEPQVDQEAEEEIPEESDELWRTVLYVGGGTLAGLAVLLGPGFVMLGVKAARRRRRRLADRLPDRVSGGWDEVVDAAADAGARLGSGATRREDAVALAALYPGLGLQPLAGRADAAVFGAGEPTAAQVEAYWADVETARRGIAGQVPVRARLRRFYAPASLFGRARR